MERLTVRVPESEETYLSCEKCGKKAFSECWDEMDCKQTAIDRLAAIEDILGDEYDLYRLRELVEADRDGRCVVLPVRGYTDKDGEKALNSAMNTCFYHNNPVTRYIADAVAEKLTCEAAEAALRRDQE